MTLALNVMSPHSLLQAFGVLGVVVVLFAETGLLVGFFLPGDTLLFTAGFFASAAAVHSTGVHLSLTVLMIGAPIGAILGAQVGHFIGRKAGSALFQRPNSRLFRRERLEQAEFYFHKFGPMRAVVLARFIPIVRTFLNPIAGTLEMPAVRFLIANVIGAVLWTEGILLVGYYLGAKIPNIDRYILPVIAIAVLASLVGVAREVLRGGGGPRSTGKHAADRVRQHVGEE